MVVVVVVVVPVAVAILLLLLLSSSSSSSSLFVLFAVVVCARFHIWPAWDLSQEQYVMRIQELKHVENTCLSGCGNDASRRLMGEWHGFVL